MERRSATSWSAASSAAPVASSGLTSFPSSDNTACKLVEGLAWGVLVTILKGPRCG